MRLLSTFQLKPETSPQGEVVIRSDNVAMGLVFLLAGALVAWIFVTLVTIMGDYRHNFHFYREPFHVDTRAIDERTDRLNAWMKERDPNAKPLPKISEVVIDDPGGFDWGQLGMVLMTHGFILAGVIATGLGARMMFTSTTVTFFHGGGIRWHEVGLFKTSHLSYELNQVCLVLNPARIRNPRGLDWEGYALWIAAKDGRKFMIARDRDPDRLSVFAGSMQEAVGIGLDKIPS